MHPSSSPSPCSRCPPLRCPTNAVHIVQYTHPVIVSLSPGGAVRGTAAAVAHTARYPVVLCATEATGKASQEKGLSAASGSFHGLHRDLVAALEAAGARSVALNPVTELNIAKALGRVVAVERLALPAAAVAAIAEAANGDLYNAISTLQFVCTGAAAAAPAAAPKKARAGARCRPALRSHPSSAGQLLSRLTHSPPCTCPALPAGPGHQAPGGRQGRPGFRPGHRHRVRRQGQRAHPIPRPRQTPLQQAGGAGGVE